MFRVSIEGIIIVCLTTFVSDLQARYAAHEKTKEYCQFDTFSGRCAEDEIIIIEEANYGRMRSGRCISGEGYIGCSTDVTAFLETACAGRNLCNVTVTSLTDVVQPCKRDYTSYLEASYSCQKVAYDSSDSCLRTRSPLFELSESSGYLSSHVLHTLPAGSEQCPWRVRSEPGQTIELHLIIYKPGADSVISAVSKGAACPWFLVIRDETNEEQVEKLCSRSKLYKHFLTSTRNSILLYFVGTDSKTEEAPVFVVHYKVTGCPNKVSDEQSGLVFTRSGNDLTVQCQGAKDTWYLTCTDNKWIGVYENCTTKATPGLLKKEGFNIPFPQGLIIAVILGLVLGLIIGTVSLIALFIYRRRRHHHNHDDGEVQDFYTHEKLRSTAELPTGHEEIYRGPMSPYPQGGFFLAAPQHPDSTMERVQHPRCVASLYGYHQHAPGGSFRHQDHPVHHVIDNKPGHICGGRHPHAYERPVFAAVLASSHGEDRPDRNPGMTVVDGIEYDDNKLMSVHT